MSSLRRSITILIILFLLMIGGALGYNLIEGWSFFDALYMTVITLATVGFQETHRLSETGRVFTMFLIMGGIGIITYGVSTITSFVIEGEINGYLRRRRMNRALGKIGGHFIVCGGGNGGLYVHDELRSTKRKVVIVEKDRVRVDELTAKGYHVVEGNATTDEALIAAGITRAAGLVSVLPEDRDNLFAVITARGLNNSLRIVSKIVDVNATEKFIRSGANSAVSAAFIGGLRMASELVRPETVSFLDRMLRDTASYRVEDVPVGRGFDGKTIRDCLSQVSSDVLVVGLKHNGEYQFNPRPSVRVSDGDTLIVIGDPEQIRVAVSVVNG